LFLNNTIKLKGIEDIKYTNDESKNGFTVCKAGFAILNTEPKRAAAIRAAIKPAAIYFLSLLYVIIRNTPRLWP
jgi:hypothetical protein